MAENRLGFMEPFPTALKFDFLCCGSLLSNQPLDIGRRVSFGDRFGGAFVLSAGSIPVGQALRNDAQNAAALLQYGFLFQIVDSRVAGLCEDSTVRLLPTGENPAQSAFPATIVADQTYAFPVIDTQ